MTTDKLKGGYRRLSWGRLFPLHLKQAIAVVVEDGCEIVEASRRHFLGENDASIFNGFFWHSRASIRGTRV